MKGTRRGKGPPSADLLVCFPSRAHLTLMPKPICSPARHSDSSKRHHNHDLKKISTRIGGIPVQSSPLLWAKSKNSEIISEPTSPKVTCAGQIKVRPKQGSSCKNWQSVMEEIEKLHNRKAQKKKGSNWMEAIGIKKDVMQFLTCLRNIRFEFRCFGSFPTTAHDITSDDEEEEEEEEEDEDELKRRGMNQIGRDINDHEDDDELEEEASRTVFSKWFMVLQDENQKTERDNNDNDDDNVPNCVPPPNALLLMRCRSAPPKSWLQETQQQQQVEEEEDEDNEEEKKAKLTMEEMENKKKNENLVVMRYGNDFHKFSADIAKETWVVGGVRDQLAKSRSWKR